MSAPLARGYYVLQTDGGMVSSGRRKRGDAPGEAAIGVVLRSPKLLPIRQVARRIGPATQTVAEYLALIEGLELARGEGIEQMRVYLDFELVVEQVNGRSDVDNDELKPLCAKASSLIEQFRSVRLSWIPREWNQAADKLVEEAFTS